MQQNVLDSINIIKRINEFFWTIAKLKILVVNSLNESSKLLTKFTKLLQEVPVTNNSNMLLSKTIKQIMKIILFQIIKKFFSKINESAKERFS